MGGFSIICIIILALIVNFLLLQYLLYKNIDVFQYKIKSYSYSIFVSISYILIFFVLLYVLRFYALGKSVNLKDFYHIILQGLFLPFTITYKVVLCFTFLLLILFLFLFFVVINHYCLKHIYMLYFYYSMSYDRENPNKVKKGLSEIIKNVEIKVNTFYGFSDIITYYFFKLLTFCMLLLYGETFNTLLLSKYHFYTISTRILFSKRYEIFIKISPLIFVVYDCIFNNYILFHIYYFLILYIPLILFARLTTFLGSQQFVVCNAIWEMYYSKNNDCCGNPTIYAISLIDKPLLDYLFINKFSTQNSKEFLDVDLSVHLFYSLLFSNNLNSTFSNSENVTVTFINNKLLTIIEDDDGNISYGEEWILLHYNQDVIKN